MSNAELLRAADAPLHDAGLVPDPSHRRVVHVIGDGRPGGGTTFVLNLAGATVGHGFDPTIVTQENSYLLHRARKAGFTAIGMDFATRARSLALSLRLKKVLMGLDPALIHLHGTRAGLPVALSGTWIRRPVVYTVHGLHFHHKTGLRRWAGRVAESICFKCARETVFVSAGDKEQARQESILAHARRSRVLVNAIPPLAAVLHDEAAKTKTYDIAFLGRLEPQKNPLIIADILAALRPARPTMCIVGGGSLEQELRYRITSRGLAGQVTWCGPLEHEKALAQVARARLLLLPSAWEGMPISLIEAMHLGLPAVASNIPGNDEVVRDGETGYLVPALAVAVYAARLRALLIDDALAASMSKAAIERSASRFSFKEHVWRHVALYQEHAYRNEALSAHKSRSGAR
jgi:glycosyltransferase involved in cell wall biosynthesis